jgi:hypothetical protein
MFMPILDLLKFLLFAQHEALILGSDDPELIQDK